jgi:hypothetical protein
MADYQLISSDSHVSEPPDLWVQRIDRKYQDRAPKVVLNPEGQEGACTTIGSRSIAAMLASA